MKTTPGMFPAFRERPGRTLLTLLALFIGVAIAPLAVAQDIFGIDSAPRTSIRTRTEWGVRDFHVLEDGRVIVLGNFRFVDGQLAEGIVRLHGDGRLDQTFASPYPGQQILRAGLVPGGRLIVRSVVIEPPIARQVIHRLLPDGTIDPTFAEFDASSLQVQVIIGLPDGGAYVLSQAGPNTMRVVRLQSNGHVDPTYSSAPLSGSFVNAGVVGPAGQLALFRGSAVLGPAGVMVLSPSGIVQPPLLGIPANFRTTTANFDPSGSLVLAGSASIPANLCLLRVFPDGTRDPGFDGTAPFPSGAGGSLARLTDGTYVVSGPGPLSSPPLLHFSATGSYLGSRFGSGPNGAVGSVQLRANPTGGAYAFGSFLELGGVASPNIARIGADLNVDPGYFVDITGSGRVHALAPFGSGHVLAGVFSEIGDQDIVNIATFGPEGTFAPLPAVLRPGVQRGIGTADGGVILLGSVSPPSGPALGAVKLQADGTFQNGFLSWLPQNSAADVAEQPDGKLIFGGRLSVMVGGTPVINLFRANADGTLDSSFLSQSPVAGGTGQGITAVAVDSAGGVIVAGSFTTFQGLPRPGLARVLPNGVVDPDFAPTVGFATNASAPRFLHVLPDGSFYGVGLPGGLPSGPSRLVRFRADGSLHESQLNLPTLSTGSYALHPDGSIFIVGASSTSGMGVFRVLASGELDPLFEARFDIGTTSPIVVDDVGRVLVGGVFGRVNDQPIEGLVRFAPVSLSVAIDGPADVARRKHSELTFSATVTGSRTPASHQWYLDGQPIEGATGPTLTLPRLKPKDAGAYTVSASTAGGTVSSSAVTLTILPGEPEK